MREAKRQMPEKSGRVPVVGGEAARAVTSDEATRPRHETESTGSALLMAALTRENLQQVNRPTSTADAIEAFLEARNSIASFNWQPPHGMPGKWICREWSAQKTSPNTRSVSAVFDEVFEV